MPETGSGEPRRKEQMSEHRSGSHQLRRRQFRLRGKELRRRATPSGLTPWTLSSGSLRISARFTGIAPLATMRPWPAAWHASDDEEVMVIGNRKGGIDQRAREAQLRHAAP